MNHLRAAAALLVLPVILTACSAAQDVAEDVRDVASDIAQEPPFSGQESVSPDGSGDGGATGGSSDGSSDTTDGGSTAGNGGADADPSGASATDGEAPPVPTNDLGGVGVNGKPMLRASYPAMVLEVDVQSCTQADQGALDHLVATLRSVVDKPGGIRFAGGNTFDSDRRQWSTPDLRATAQAHRSTYSSSDTVSVYLLYVCGGLHADGQETSAIGVAYNASEVAIFPQKWNDGIGTLLGSNRAVERAVLVHELGHLFGLVNITYDSEIAHEDPEHPGHSDNRGSVMFWAIESTAIGQVFSGPPPDVFDEADRADLQGLKSGKY